MELTLDQALRKGIEAHKAGKIQDAERYYTAILKVNPKHPDANHNLGVLAGGLGKVQEGMPFFKKALESDPKVKQYWLSYIDALIKLNLVADGKAVLSQAKSMGLKGDGFDQLEERLQLGLAKRQNVQGPPQQELNSLLALYDRKEFKKVFVKAQEMSKLYTKSLVVWNLMGASAANIGQPDYAVQAFKKALLLEPNSAVAHNNMGNALQDKGHLGEAIKAYTKAISLKPDFCEAYNNMGNALKDQGKLEEAIKAYTKAISLKPDFANAYNNMGNALKDQGKLEEAIKACDRAISLKPDYADAHRNLSTIKRYTLDDEHFLYVKKYFKTNALNDDQRCNLSFALAKMYEDIGELDKAFRHLSQGNSLRKKLLNYSINNDRELFTKLKETQSFLIKSSLGITQKSGEFSPIFIVGMPRSGTTLIEQIISSHSEVTGAGELGYVFQFGKKLAEGHGSISTALVSEFRKSYLRELSKVSNGKLLVTDKMPQNFRFIALICAAFPEAKIIHVHRDAAATCWSNYKQYFVAKDLGYCYNLNDVVEYYGLYKDLMMFWKTSYGDCIFDQDYEELIVDQEKQTRKLLRYLELDWEEACLSPHKNKRSVRTASQQQVRQMVYQGSSEAWVKYKPFINGAFDKLLSK